MAEDRELSESLELGEAPALEIAEQAEDEARFARKCALVAAQAADEKKAEDIVVQRVRELIGVTDYFLTVTANNPRQVQAIVDEVEDELREECSLKPLARELSADGTWSLLDFGILIVHVFQVDAREHYRLENLWKEAPLIDLEQEGMHDIKYSERIAKLIAEAEKL